MRLPASVTEVIPEIFARCRPKVLQVGEEYDFSTMEYLLPTTEALKIQTQNGIVEVNFLELRATRDLRLPNGLGVIGKSWFAGGQMESVQVPASVRRIENSAFRDCRNLRRIVFAEGSLLEEVCADAFEGTGLSLE